MASYHEENEILSLWRNEKEGKLTLFKIDFPEIQKQPLEISVKKDVLRNFAKFTGKHLCQSLVFDKVAG